MHSNRLAALCILTVSLTGCVAQPPLHKATASGHAEAVFPNTPIADVRSRIMDGCVSRGGDVEQSSDNQVVCARTLTGGKAFAAQLLIGNAYSTPPVDKVRFTIYALEGKVHASATEWIETQMPGGQVNRVDANGNIQRNGLQDFFDSIGGE